MLLLFIVMEELDLRLAAFAQAEAAAQAAPTPITSLLIQSVNEVIDLSEERLAAFENRIPRTI